MPTKNHNLLLHRAFQYATIVLIVAAMGGGYWYWKQAQAGVTQKTANNQGLVGYWSFDEGSGTQAGDASGNGNAGTLTNGPTWVDGKLGKALNFDGTDDYVSTATNNGSGSALKTVTIAGWFKTSTASGHAIVGLETNQTGTASLDYSPNIYIGTDGKVYFHTYATGNKYAVSTNSYTDGNWHHVVGVCSGDSTSIKLYIDGVLQQTTGIGTVYASFSSSYWRIGSYQLNGLTNGSNGYFSGSIDEVRIYNRALEATEIANLYALGAAKLQKTQSSDLTSGLVGYWPFNGKDISGTTAYDRSGQGNNGTLTNGPTITEGRSGQALSFNGSNTSVPVTNGYSSVTNNFTISFWAYPRSTHEIDAESTSSTTGVSGQKYVIGPAHGGSNAGAGVSMGTNGISVYEHGDAYMPPLLVDQSTYTEWTHVTVVYESKQPKLYVNGILKRTGLTSPKASVFPGLESGNARIGAYISYGHFNGSIDEPRIYNRALSAGEVWDLYQMGKPDEVNTGASQADPLEKGMVGYWKLDDASGTSASDASGNANTGTLTNGPTWTTGQIGGATSFDGTNDYIDAGTGPRPTGPVSVSVWAKTNISSNQVILGSRGSSGGTGFRFELKPSGIIGFTYYNVLDWSSTANAAVTNGNWHHYVFSNQASASGQASFYVDGKLHSSSASVVGGAASNQIFAIGALQDTSGITSFFNGSIDEVRVYNRALSADEVAKLYKTTAPDDPDTGLVGYWSFNGPDLSGTTAFDRSGKGNNGTLTNGPTVTEGKSGQALNFNGSSNYVTMGYVLSFSGTQSLSMSAWIKPNVTNVSYQTLVGKELDYKLDLDSGGKVNFLLGNSWGRNFASDTSLVAGNWYHIVATYDGTNKKMYINGSWDKTVASTGNISGNSYQFNIGQRNSDDYFNGIIDEVRIYNRALTQAEVTALYNAGR